MEVTEDWKIFSLNIPKGQVTSFGIFFFAFAFGIIGYLSQDWKGYIYTIVSVILIVFGVLVYSGLIPCKERLIKEGKKR